MVVTSKPVVLICSTPVYGHLMPIVSIAKALIARGYEVTFCTGSAYKDLIQATGATFVPLEGYCDYTEADLPTKFAARAALPPGPVQLIYDMEQVFVRSMESQWQCQQKALRHLEETKPGRKIALLTEAGFLGSVPTYLGAPGVQPSATIGIGVIPVVLSSIDLPPIGPGLPPDSTPEGRKRNIASHKKFMEVFSSPMKMFQDSLKSLGARNEERFFFDSVYLLPDRFVQMCLPSVEYPRSDAPSSMRFAGKLPPGGRVKMTNPPTWWTDIATNSEKKIVFVCQGTIATNIEELIVPTMLAFKDSEDVIVVVALGKVGASLPPGTPVPANARVADFIPFDDILPYCNAFVTNGGYGGFQHGIGNGIPMVLGGATEDKPEVAARAEWCGVGLNLRTATPTPEALREAVTTIFSDPKYKKRALELQEETKAYDPISVLVDNMNELL